MNVAIASSKCTSLCLLCRHRDHTLLFGILICNVAGQRNQIRDLYRVTLIGVRPVISHKLRSSQIHDTSSIFTVVPPHPPWKHRSPAFEAHVQDRLGAVSGGDDKHTYRIGWAHDDRRFLTGLFRGRNPSRIVICELLRLITSLSLPEGSCFSLAHQPVILKPRHHSPFVYSDDVGLNCVSS
jgi:hypothetical protein